MTTVTEKLRATALLLTLCCVGANADSRQDAASSTDVTVDQNGIGHIPAYDLPLSSYMSEEAKEFYIRQSQSLAMPAQSDIAKVRDDIDRILLAPQLKKAKALYDVAIESRQIAGVDTEVVTPREGVPKRNQNRVLIHLHGGGLTVGTGMLQLVESIPVAAVAKIKVISIDYRLAPEHKFPAANQDIAAVYRALLQEYPAQNIGLFGHSVGGALVGMSTAWFQREKLPKPGALGIFSSAEAESGGDSRFVAAPLDPLSAPYKIAAPPAFPNPPPLTFWRDYVAGANAEDPVIQPFKHPDVLARFPPTLLVTGTRDQFASSTMNYHRRLIRAGVEAELHVWDGMWHTFMMEANLPEAQEMYAVTASFFDRYLGTAR